MQPSKTSWRDLAVHLWPNKFYDDPSDSVGLVLSYLHFELLEAYQAGDEINLAKIYDYAEWCYQQGKIDPEIGDSAVIHFYEHLVDVEVTYQEIPKRIKPEMFSEFGREFEYRLDEMPRKYPVQRPGTFAALVLEYDRQNNTDFAKQWGIV
ncbi:MAG: hypothetical protein JNL09_03195 [Anaerolineales bacterium]|nr:hypothetical protein [Anaerolineales bacterium]